MNWTLIIKDLLAAGLTQVEIAREVQLAQSTISDLYRGELKSTSYESGSRLIELHKRYYSQPA